ncbi:MAG: site-specific integrase, partial [Deltaproteobacteria bacterium]|nr:site-specific integrase [Deltaproteobacteria bacterium]
MNFAEALHVFERFLRVERNASTHTRRAYGADVAQFAAFCAGDRDLEAEEAFLGAHLSPAACTKQDVRNYLAELHRRNHPATQGRKLSAIRSFFHFLVREEVCATDPTGGLPGPRTPKRLPRPLAVDDCLALVVPLSGKASSPSDGSLLADGSSPAEGSSLAEGSSPAEGSSSAEGSSPAEGSSSAEGSSLAEGSSRELSMKELRTCALIELLYGAGIRVGELVSLNLEDVELTRGEVRVWGKGNKERIVPLPRLVCVALHAYLARRERLKPAPEPSHPLFSSL